VNILDENVLESQRQLFRSWHMPVRQLGLDIGRKGMKDEQIPSFLLTLLNPTFLTRDLGFYNRGICHHRYCIICLAVGKYEVAAFARRVLRHREFKTRGKRVGAVLWVSHKGISLWRVGVTAEGFVPWRE